MGGLAGPAAASTASTVAQAKKYLLTLAEMPKSWTSAKSSNNNGSLPGSAQLAHCIGVPTSLITSSPPTAYSPQFSSKNQLLSVSDNVSIYRTAKAAKADFSTLANRKTPSCLTSVLNGPAKHTFQSGFGAGASVGSVLASRSPAADFPAHTTNITMFFPVTYQKVAVNVELILVDYVTGTKEQTLALTGVQSTFPASLAKSLSALAVRRL